jgi:O-antigen/teichoic acid export membrane protein
MRGWLARLGERPVLRRIAANIGWLVADKLLKAAVGLVMAVWLARYLGPAGFGHYSYVLAFVALFGGFATLGLPQIGVRELVREPAARGEILGTVLALLLVGALAAALLVALAIGVVRPHDTAARLAVVVVSGTLLFQCSAVARYWFESQVASRHVVVAEAVALLAGAALKAALILAGAPVLAFFWAALAESALMALALLLAYQRRVGDGWQWRASLARARGLMAGAWPIALSGALLMVQARVDQFMLAELAGERELGYYSVALRVAEGLVFFSLILQSTLYPVLVQARKASWAEFHTKLMSFYRASVLAALAVCVPVALLAPWLVQVLFGSAYEPAGPLLAWMAGRVLLAFLGVARSVFLLIENLQSWATLTLAVGTVLNIALNALWIPEFRGTGAVWASLVSFTVTSLALDLLNPRTRRNVLDLGLAALTCLRLREAVR